jgi:ADP-ribose pyrophosphatase YjhB (NUDIX family)
MKSFTCDHCGKSSKHEFSGKIPICKKCEEKANRMAAGILFTNGDKILLLKRDGNSDHAGTWCIPGGRANANEQPIETAKRETKEECGHLEGYQFAHFHNQFGNRHFYTYLYVIKKPFDCELSKEHVSYKWVSLNKVEEMKLHPRFKESWKDYLKAIQKQFPSKNFAEWVKIRESCNL